MAGEGRPVTSEGLAKAMNSNPVVLRRVMAGLRNKGYVRSEKGHGGGWTLACDLSEVTLRDVYQALGSLALFTLGNRSESPDCLIEQTVNRHLNHALIGAEQQLLSHFGKVTLAMLYADIQLRQKKRRRSVSLEKAHAS
jgi:DNA-binding IscR family transcriptional regulator